MMILCYPIIVQHEMLGREPISGYDNFSHFLEKQNRAGSHGLIRRGGGAGAGGGGGGHVRQPSGSGSSRGGEEVVAVAIIPK